MLVQLQWSKPICIWLRSSWHRCLPCCNFSVLHCTSFISTSLHLACYWSVFMMLLLRGILDGPNYKLSSGHNLHRKWHFVEIGMFHWFPCTYFRPDRLWLKSKWDTTSLWFLMNLFWPEAWCFYGPHHGDKLPRIPLCDKGCCVSRIMWLHWIACERCLLQSQGLKKSLMDSSHIWGHAVILCIYLLKLSVF